MKHTRKQGLRHSRGSAHLLSATWLVPLWIGISPLNGAAADFDHHHGAWSSLLQKYVRQGSVDYGGIVRDGRPHLDAYLRQLEAVDKTRYRSFTKKQKLAFLINVYNAYTVRAVVDSYPVSSIRKIGPKDGAVWKKKLIPLTRIWGRNLSLDELEHDIIRVQFQEPRIHFALNCAAKGCPRLRAEAYTAPALEKQLHAQAMGFLSRKNRFDSKSGILYLSELFKWFAADFTAHSKSVEAYVAPYMSAEVQEAVARGKVTVKYLSYDWSLNGI